MLRAFGGSAAAALVVLPLAMLASRLSISRRYGTTSCGRLRSHRTNMSCLGAQTPQIEFRFSTKFDKILFLLLLC